MCFLSFSLYFVMCLGAMAKAAPVTRAANAFEGNGTHSEMIVKYREYADQKRDLKKRLKKFDEDFLSQHGRAPRKSDKEVIRPMYQKYHEVGRHRSTCCICTSFSQLRMYYITPSLRLRMVWKPSGR